MSLRLDRFFDKKVKKAEGSTDLTTSIFPINIPTMTEEEERATLINELDFEGLHDSFS